jgi:hypothetical protein
LFLRARRPRPPLLLRGEGLDKVEFAVWIKSDGDDLIKYPMKIVE